MDNLDPRLVLPCYRSIVGRNFKQEQEGKDNYKLDNIPAVTETQSVQRC